MSSEPSSIPPRPSVPSLGWFALSVWMGILGAESLAWGSWVSGRGDAIATAAGVAAFFCVAAALMGRRGYGALALMSLALGAGLIGGSLYWASWAAHAEALAATGSQLWNADVLTDPRTGRFADRSEVSVRTTGGRVRVSASWPEGEAPEAGRHVQFYGVMKRPATDEFGRRSHQAGVCASVNTRAVRDTGWSSGLRGFVGPVRADALAHANSVPGVGGDLLAGVVLGDRRRLSGTQAESDFRITGLTHLVAISGSHLVVVAALVTWGLSVLRVPRSVNMVTVVVVIGLYVVATGVQPSAVRAWAMAVVGSGAGLSGRRADSLAGLAAAAAVAVCTWPPVAFDLGFRLSVLAVAGLVVYARLVSRWVGTALPAWFASLAPAIALTLTAQAATMPLTVSTFGTFSMIAPLANLLAGPLVSAVLLIGLLGVSIAPVWSALGSRLLMAAGAVGALTSDVAAWLASIPYASVPLGAFSPWASALLIGGSVGLWAWWPAPKKTTARFSAAVAAFVCVAVVSGPPAPSGVTLTVMDVGQGDAILVRDGPHALLVDTGPDVSSLRSALSRAGVRRLEAVALTHTHLDHTGGLPALVRMIPVGRVLVTRGAALPLEKEIEPLNAPVFELEAGDRFEVGSVSVQVLSPSGVVPDPAENSSSLVLLVRAAGFSALLTGDAEADVMDPLVSAGVISDIDVLKVGHHGSADAVSSQSLAAMRPEVALISVGQGNRFGHPVSSTVSLLESSGTRVLRTDRAGDLAVHIGDDGRWRVETRGHMTADMPCATLSATADAAVLKGADEYHHVRSQAGLPYHQRAGVLTSTRARQAESARGRSRGYRLQLRSVRRGHCVGRCDSDRVQHAAVRLRSPPRGGT